MIIGYFRSLSLITAENNIFKSFTNRPIDNVIESADLLVSKLLTKKSREEERGQWIEYSIF